MVTYRHAIKHQERLDGQMPHDPAYVLALQAKAERQQSAQERDAQLIALREEGKTFAQIATILGYNSYKQAHQAYWRALDRMTRFEERSA